MKNIILKKGREKSLLQKHPWIFSGAIDNVSGEPGMGETVKVISSKNEYLGTGFFSPHSQIRVRIWSFKDEAIDNSYFEKKIKSAFSLRKDLINFEQVNAFRLINSESDGLPGLVVDKYDDYLVCQFLSAGVEQRRDTVTEILNKLLQPKGIYERSDSNVRQKEGLKYRKGILSGPEPPPLVEITEYGIKYYVDIINGHKSGFYLDQRDNRRLISKYSKTKKVLNCFSYTGGFGLAAAKAGAGHVLNLDSSKEVLDLCDKNFQLNGISSGIYQNKPADIFKELRNLRDNNEKFDLIVMDPPKFAENKSMLTKAAHGYKDINMLAFQLLNNNGILFTFSCSGLIQPELFQKIIADAALDAGVTGTVIKKLHQAPDHRIILNFPESSYLKGFVIRKED